MDQTRHYLVVTYYDMIMILKGLSINLVMADRFVKLRDARGTLKFVDLQENRIWIIINEMM